MDINRAKEIIKSLAEGIDPTTGEVLSDDNVCNKGEVVRAFYAVLDELKTNRVGKPSFDNYDEDLFEKLKVVRKELADEESCPAFMILTNASLKDMSIKQPTTKAEFLKVYGIGARKTEHYAQPFISAIEEYLEYKAN